MRKNQKYTKEEMQMAIELWKESGLSQQKFCIREGLPLHIFKYWNKKLKGKRKTTVSTKTTSFIPVEVSKPKEQGSSQLELPSICITYPNGARIECPSGTSPQQLSILVNL